MSCQKSSPSSPNRGLKMPKKSSSSSSSSTSQWNECNDSLTQQQHPQHQQSINFYDSNYEQQQQNNQFTRSTRSMQDIKETNPQNTKSKINKPLNVICQNDPQNSTTKTLSSLNNFNINTNNSKYENAPRSPKITTTYAEDNDDSNCGSYYQNATRSPRSPKQLPSTPSSSGAFNYYNDNQNQSPHSSLNIQKKFTFDAISPSNEPKGKAFEYYEPISPDENLQQTSIINQLRSQDESTTKGNKSNNFTIRGLHQHNIKNRPMLPQSPVDCSNFTINSIQKLNRNDKLSNDLTGSSDTNNFKQYYLLEESPTGSRNIYMKRDSCMTEMTQFTNDSYDTNVSINTATTSLSNDSPKKRKESCEESISKRTVSTASDKSGHNVGSISSNGDNIKICGRNRRDAINIISNPGYQVLHSSHSTLDRTCSDSVFSLRCRKSTSDLTKVEPTEGSAPSLNQTKKRRRGSSKGGLAYLASRRSSRDSIKSACSNTSIFSNENVGPLAFQASVRGRTRRTSNFLELPIPDHVRPRVCSLPDRPYNPRISDDLYRLRHFSISKGNVVNCGDSIISRRSRSNTSVNSTNSRASERSPFEFDGSCCGGGYANVDSMPPSPTDNSEEPPPPPRYRIVMLGDAGVGKTALVSQFMTSEYMHTYDASLDDEFGEKTVSILLDDEESELVFIDHPSVEMSVENSLSTYEPHACVIVYSVVDRNSFRIAEDTINYLWKENITKTKAVILVGNKADLARSRSISTSDGKSLAATRDVKFIETSSGIQHNVDELLVGALKQIRLKEKRDKKRETKMKTSRTHISLYLAKEILQKMCLTDITKSKSCENLHVL